MPNFFASHQDHSMADEIVESLEEIRVEPGGIRMVGG